MRILLAICFLLAGLNGAAAANIKLLTAGAFKPVVLELIPDFERQTGHKVTIDNDTAGGLARRIAGGEAFDVVVLTPAALEPLVAAGKVVGDSVTPLAKVGIGVAVGLGAPLPDISNVESFRRTLLAARAIAYINPNSGGTSGSYLASLFQRLGIASEVARKSVLVVGGHAAERLASGEADIALSSANP